jgi:hypothetical protein
VVPKDVGQLRNRGVVVGKNVGIHLVQCLLYLCLVQFHRLLLLLLRAAPRLAVDCGAEQSFRDPLFEGPPAPN